MLSTDVRAISVDDHIIEPPDLWQSRLPSRYLDAAPRVVELDDGDEAWLLEDQVVKTRRGNTLCQPGLEGDPLGVARFADMRPGCFDPVARLADMEADGVWAQVNFPDFSRFAGHRFLELRDRELAMLCVQAYNDFAIDEWRVAAPDRLFPVAILPLWDVEAAADEVRRVAGAGLRAIAFSENPVVLGLPSIYGGHWDPLWRAVEDTGLTVCLHVGSSSKLLKSADDAPECSVLPYVGANSMIACTDWMFSGVLDRFRGIKVAFSEGGAGWVPYLLEQASDVFDTYGERQIASTRPPREVFAEHLYVCVLRDETAFASIDAIGADNIMWESDYPHDSTSFPDSRVKLEHSMRDVPDDVAANIAEHTARRVFGI